MKKFIQKNYLNWKYSNETMYSTARKSIKIGVGLTLVIIAVFIIFHPLFKPDYSFSRIKSNPNEVIKKLESGNNKDMTLLLYRDDCKYCKKIEQPLVKEIVTSKKDSLKKIVTMNVNDMSSKELETLKEKVPAILVDGDKIPTPLVANLNLVSKNEIRVISKSNTGELTEIDKLIN